MIYLNVIPQSLCHPNRIIIQGLCCAVFVILTKELQCFPFMRSRLEPRLLTDKTRLPMKCNVLRFLFSPRTIPGGAGETAQSNGGRSSHRQPPTGFLCSPGK